MLTSAWVVSWLSISIPFTDQNSRLRAQSIRSGKTVPLSTDPIYQLNFATIIEAFYDSSNALHTFVRGRQLGMPIHK